MGCGEGMVIGGWGVGFGDEDGGTQGCGENF